MGEVATFLIFVAACFPITFVLVHATSNLRQIRLRRSSDAYVEFRDHESHLILYVKKGSLFTVHSVGDVTVEEHESRNKALIEWANKCNRIAQQIYGRG